MRKAPVQTRSRQMVDGLLEATARTVAERGLEDTTTDHIAARAGGSIGSLYQYFAGKEALLDALSDKLSAEIAQLLNRRLQANLESDLHSVLRDLVTTVFEYFEAEDGLYLEMVRHWHHPRTERFINQLEQQLLELARLYFVHHHSEFRVENLPTVLFVMFNSAVFTGVRYLSKPPIFIKREEVIEGLVTMLVSFIRQVSPPGASMRGRRSR